MCVCTRKRYGTIIDPRRWLTKMWLQHQLFISTAMKGCKRSRSLLSQDIHKSKRLTKQTVTTTTTQPVQLVVTFRVCGLLKIKVSNEGFHSDAIEEPFQWTFIKRTIFLSVKNILNICKTLSPNFSGMERFHGCKRDSSPQNEYSVIIYSPSGWSKPLWVFFKIRYGGNQTLDGTHDFHSMDKNTIEANGYRLFVYQNSSKTTVAIDFHSIFFIISQWLPSSVCYRIYSLLLNSAE